MKKIALTSLLTVFAASGAMAANAIDGNPLYMPKAGAFYSVTGLASHSENSNAFGLTEEFGYGVTDKLAVNVTTTMAEDEEFDYVAWEDMTFNATFRAFDKGAWKVDAIAGYGVGPVWGDHKSFLDERYTDYAWTAGVRGGYTTSVWTVAGHVAFNYLGDESFNWDEEGVHVWTLGVDGQYVIDSNWNLVAGVEYAGITDDGFRNAGSWEGYFGVNYNFDSTKFIGAYVNASMNHQGGDAADEWELDDGVGYGVKFGIQF